MFRGMHFSFFSGSKTIVKVGEGTFGEAFKVNNYVCKIVPFDGDFRVNGEIQKVTFAYNCMIYVDTIIFVPNVIFQM